MKVIEHIKKTKSPTYSYELLPPLKGANVEQVFDIVKLIKPYNPAWINVTSHASSLEYIENAQGQIIKKIRKKRPGTMSVCGVIQNKFGIDAVAHVLCKGFSKEETENALIELNYLGVENILALCGDNLNYDKTLDKTYSINRYANELTAQVSSMKDGKFLDDTLYSPLDFCIGVAGYPEKHFAAPNIDTDIKYLKQKIDAGAEYIVTQMFFDNKKYFKFVKKCRDNGITVPIIPGLKVLKTVKQIESLPRLFNIDLPEELVKSVQDKPEHIVSVGKEWTKMQIRELIAHGINNIHFFLMNDINTVLEIVEEV
ncbi:MAG: methylenetetrahydrofolate reductase [Burkholderiales bacterium]|jgi:methylenetetrahydrofolate reductase (NADPH)|nr:methylenetetrahydrofolate reductase [Burkholderiales bacterium]